MKVEKTLLEMLKEPTGVDSLDSGSLYGRHWQRNKDLTLDKLENMRPVVIEDGLLIINVYHYLKEQLLLDKYCIEFNKINTNADNWESDIFYGTSIEAEEYLTKIGAVVKDS